MEVTYFGEASELHVHLLNIDLFPWSFSPILYTGLTQRGKWKHLICDSQMKYCPLQPETSSICMVWNSQLVATCSVETICLM